MLKNGKKKMRAMKAILCSIVLVLTNVLIFMEPIGSGAQEAVQPDSTLRKISLGDFGIADGTYNKANSCSGTYPNGMQNTYFSAKVTFSTAAQLFLGGTDEEKGLRFSLSSSNLLMKDADDVVSDSYKFKPDEAGLSETTFKNTEFTLGVTLQVTNLDTDGAEDDVKIGVWFNGTLYKGEYIEFIDYASHIGGVLSTKFSNNSAQLDLFADANVGVSPKATWQKLTFSHFYLEDGSYGYNEGNVAAKGSYPVSLNQTYFTGNVTFSEHSGASLRYGGKKTSEGLAGLMFGVVDGKLRMEDALGSANFSYVYDAKEAGLDFASFAGKQFKLGISIEYVDSDDDGQTDDVSLGVWFNDVLYGNEYVVLPDYVNLFGAMMGIISYDEQATVTIASIQELVAVMPDANLKTLTFESFSLEDKVYQYNSGRLSAKGNYNGKVDGTYFGGTVAFSVNASGKSSEIRYATTDADGWVGLRFYVSGEKLLVRHALESKVYAALEAATAGIKSFTEDFRLGISMQYVDMDDDDDELVDDVKLGVFFNDELYNDSYIYLENYVERVGNGLSIYCESDTTLKAGTLEEFIDYGTPIELDSSYQKITFEQFVIDDGTYTYKNGGLSAKGFYKNGLDSTWFSGTVTYVNESARLIFGTNQEGWEGLYFKVVGDNMRLAINDSGAKAVFTPKHAGVSSFKDTPFHLGISAKIVDIDEDGKDDVELGVWFNDVLYKNEFIYLEDYAEKLGSYLSIYCPKETSLTIASRENFIPSIPIVEPDSGMTQLTFDSFCYVDKTVAFNNNFLSGKGIYRKTMDNTHFTGTVLFTGEGPDIRYGGSGDGWTGLQITIRGGKMVIKDAAGKTETYQFVAKKAGLDSFINTEFKLGISTKFVDSDSDGVADDVELGVWFNDRLYNGEYIYLIDYAPNLKGGLGLFVPQGDAKLTIKSIYIPLDFTIFGFTSDWENELKLYKNNK